MWKENRSLKALEACQEFTTIRGYLRRLLTRTREGDEGDEVYEKYARTMEKWWDELRLSWEQKARKLAKEARARRIMERLAEAEKRKKKVRGVITR